MLTNFEEHNIRYSPRFLHPFTEVQKQTKTKPERFLMAFPNLICTHVCTYRYCMMQMCRLPSSQRQVLSLYETERPASVDHEWDPKLSSSEKKLV